MGSPFVALSPSAMSATQDRVRILCVAFDKYVEAQVSTAFSNATQNALSGSPLLMERAVALHSSLCGVWCVAPLKQELKDLDARLFFGDVFVHVARELSHFRSTS